MIIWVIGLAGAGKTTLGLEITKRLRERSDAVVFLDGDAFRRILDDDLGHTLEDRRKNGLRMSRMCDFLDGQGITVVCSILSLFPEQRARNREAYERYFEVYIDVSMDVLEARDQKGLYSGAKAERITDVAGVDIPFIPPEAPDFVFTNDEPRDDFATVAQMIVDAIDRKFPSEC